MSVAIRKPCPFCGEPNRLGFTTSPGPCSTWRVRVECLRCGALGPPTKYRESAADDEHLATVLARASWDERNG